MMDEEEDFEVESEEKSLENLARVIVSESRFRLVISSQDEAANAAAFLSQRVQPGIARIKSAFAEAKEKAHQAHRAVVRAEKDLLGPLEQAKASITEALAVFGRASEEAAKRREIQLVERAKRVQIAVAVAEDSQEIEIPITTLAPEKIPGISFRDTWRAECDDVVALATAVASGAVNASLLLPNMPALNDLAVSLKEKFSVPGCRSVKLKTVVAARGKRR